MRPSTTRLLTLSALAAGTTLAFAQTTSTVTGVVTDASGAVIPGAQVVLTNPSNNARFEAKSDTAGSYRFSSVPPGPGYTLQFNAPGFQSSEIKGVYVNVANAVTQNAKLRAGAANVEVEVNAESQGVTINTTDASIGNNFQVSKLDDLPVQNRLSPGALFTLQPGITSTGAATGARTDQNNTTIDGLDVNDFATGSFAAITGNAPVDAIQEFRGTTGGFTADSGPGGGGQFQLVTRSGTNEFHGSLSEYHRDNSTTANTWFNDELGIRQPKLVQNQFGGTLGGPIKRDKLFFFFDVTDSRIAQDSSVLRTVPLDSFRAGNVSYINNNSGCTAASRQNTTPDCIGSLTAAQVKALDPAGIGESPEVFALLASRYPVANDLSSGDGVNTGGFRFNSATPTNTSTYLAKIDWRLNDHISFYGRGNFTRENQIQSTSQFPGDVAAGTFIDRSYAYVVGMNWQISPNKFNTFIYGSTVQDYSFPRPANALGIYQDSFATGVTTLLDGPYSSPSNSQSRHVPIPEISDNFSWTLGRHTLQMGGYFKWITAHDQNVLDYNSYGIGLGGEVQGLTAALRPANIRPSSSTAQVTYDSAFTAALGRVASLSSTFNYDAQGNPLPQPSGAVRDYRYYQTQPYFEDTWKVTPSLTMTFGVNYQYFSVPYEIHGLETVQSTGFDDYFSARLKQSAAGLSGNNAVPFISYVLGGPANHGPSLYNSNPYNFAPRFAVVYNPGFDQSTVFNASAGLVYDRTVINAVQYQQTQFSYFFQQNKTVNYGDGTDPVASLRNDPRLANAPEAVAPPTPKGVFQPYVTDGVPYGLQNGGAFNEMIDPNLKTPYSILLNAGMQHQFPGSLVLKMNYVGRLGRRLLAQADANQLIDFPDQASGQTMSQAMANTTLALRAGADPANLPSQPWWENQVTPGVGVSKGYANNTSYIADGLQSLIVKGDFADTIQSLSGLLQPNVGMAAQFSENTVYTNKGFSSYNGLLLSLQKNLNHGLQFDFNYTFSHSIDNVSLIANGVAYGGYGFICDAVHPRECRGNSDFDITHLITGDATYQLPFGRGRSFASHVPWALDEIIGGWNVSAIPTWHSGTAFGTVTSAFVAGYANDAPGIFNGDTNAIRRRVHKTSGGQMTLFDNPEAAAAAFTGPVGLQIGNRNNLRGPQYFNVDAGLAKDFTLWPDRGLLLRFRADAFNVMNHPNFNQLGYDYSGQIDITQPGNFGQLTEINGQPRVVQISARLQF